MKFFLLSFLLIFFCTISPSFALTKEQQDNLAGLEIYSDMVLIAEEGEYEGWQIIIVPFNLHYQKFREKLLWRSGNGSLEMPLLLEGVREGNTIKIIIPEGYDEHGEWILTMKGNTISVQGPRGLHHELKKFKIQ